MHFCRFSNIFLQAALQIRRYAERLFPWSLAVFLVFTLTACGNERISSDFLKETGEFYSSDALSSTRSGHSKEVLTLQADFDAFCTELFRKEMASSSTLDLHYTLLHPENYGIDAEDAALGTYRLSELIKNSREIHDLKEKLSEFDPHMLSDDQQILYDSLSERIEAGLMAEGLELYDQPLAPTIGIQAQLPILLAEYSFHSLQDVEDYLTLLSQLDSYYGDILYFEEQKAAAGLGPSDASIERILESCQSYLIDPVNNFLTETFETRLNSLSTDISLSEQQKNNFRSRHLEVIKNSFLPAYRHLIDGLSGLKGRGINEGGLCGFRNGRRYYEYLLRSDPGLSYNIEELKAALSDRMQKDLETISSLSKKTGPDLSFRLTDPPAILADLQTQMSGDFPVLSEASKKYEIRYVPAQLESTLSPAFYLTAPLDDPTRNVIYINNGSTSAKDELYPTLAHEGFPGHLYQTVYFREHTHNPLAALLTCSGANEGWATYVEQLSYFYDNGLSEETSAYQAAMRSFSLCFHSLLDIGINYDGWSKDRAAAFVRTCFDADDALVEELWQTMIDNPTNYLEYAGGYVEILEMREEAEKKLGNRFSAKEFHKFLLDLGPVPFSVTRKYFTLWLRQK
ncbi:DUF885 domain-containing protein [Clostridium sp. AM30-24]|nr:DUF885 domain-containing protein [Clostridium sp. AM30-24]RHT40071.1 DUF885 domain-containing protein [Clostridium sp. AM30-24]